MFFDLMHICIREQFVEIGFLNLSLQPKEKGTRHFLAFKWEKADNKSMFNIHFLFNWNHAWILK